MFINMVEMLRNIQWMSEAEYSFLFFFHFFFVFFFLHLFLIRCFVFLRKDRYMFYNVFHEYEQFYLFIEKIFILFYNFMVYVRLKWWNFLWKESMKFFCWNFINCYIVNVYVSIKKPLTIFFFFFFLILIVIFIIMWIFFYNIKRLFVIIAINWWLFFSLKFLFGWILIVT